MKVGDKVYCIKDKLCWAYNFHRGKEYCIIGCDEDNYFSILSDFPISDINIETFCLVNKNTSNFHNFELFSEFFVTGQEYRKMKLEKINK